MHQTPAADMPKPVAIDAPQPQARADADPGATGGAARADELTEIISAYNAVTDRLRESHETLTDEVARLQRELASANAALQRSRRLAALGEMAAGIAHEIRNPLGSIQLYANMLREDLADNPAHADLAEKIADAVRGLNGIVGDVLAFSREIRLNPADVSAHDLFQRTLAAMKPAIEAAGVAAAVDGEDLQLRADPDHLQQALVNLVRNACEAMDTGGRLTLSAKPGDAAVELFVRDTGPGIDDEQVDRIFNPFVTTRATGTGLGLAIVHRIVDAHGGAIAVHNDQGAVFTLTLPNTPPPDNEPRPSGSGCPDRSQAAHSLPNRRGSCADPDPEEDPS